MKTIFILNHDFELTLGPVAASESAILESHK